MQDSHYNPQTGRFISEDLLGFAGLDENLYRYVENNPTNFVDPYGEFPQNPQEAAECYTGTIDRLIQQREANIERNKKNIEQLKKKLEELNSNQICSKPGEREGIKSKTKVLEQVNKQLSRELSTLREQCSGFPFRQ